LWLSKVVEFLVPMAEELARATLKKWTRVLLDQELDSDRQEEALDHEIEQTEELREREECLENPVAAFRRLKPPQMELEERLLHGLEHARCLLLTEVHSFLSLHSRRN